jgi:intraflagellar transport protein 52
MNRPICAVWEAETMSGDQRGRLIVVGSVELFGDEWIDKEENAKLCDVLFSWLVGDLEVDMTSDRADSQLWEYTRVPNIEAMSQNIKPCLQGMDDLPKDFTKNFNLDMFHFDTRLIPQAVALYETLGVPHDPLTLIPPQFECPLPKLTPATFPPAMREPPPPALDQFDLDEHFAPEGIRLAQLTNKCTGGDDDLEYYIAECGEILGVVNQLPFGERSAKHIMFHIFKHIVAYKKQDAGKSFFAGEHPESVPAYTLESSEFEDTRGNAIPLMHVDLVPMKLDSVSGKNNLQSLDPQFTFGGPAIGSTKFNGNADRKAEVDRRESKESSWHK